MERAVGTTLGNTTKKLTPPNNNKADFEKAAADLIKDGCTDVLLFISSHGEKGFVTMGTGTYTPAEMKKLIKPDSWFQGRSGGMPFRKLDRPARRQSTDHHRLY